MKLKRRRATATAHNNDHEKSISIFGGDHSVKLIYIIVISLLCSQLRYSNLQGQFIIFKKEMKEKSSILPTHGNENENAVQQRKEESISLSSLTASTSVEGGEEDDNDNDNDAYEENMTTNKTPATLSVSAEALAATAASTHDFPNTIFTEHVQEIIGEVRKKGLANELGGKKSRYWPETHCPYGYRFIVDKPYTAPSIECNKAFNAYCKFFVRLFASKTMILPHNVSLGTSQADMTKRNSNVFGECLANSAPKGRFSMTNFQDMKRNANFRTNTTLGWENTHRLPWEQRKKKPVFRGRARWNADYKKKKCPTHVRDMGHRPKAADWSADNPDLLDAAISYQKNPCDSNSKTNGMDRMFQWGDFKGKALPPTYIPPEKYYGHYQTAVVLGGIGAAFRVGRHLSAGQAVVLQTYTYEEWFVKFMLPYVHYIPLKQDLSDLKEVMEWVRDHPAEVKTIAEKGEKFYWEYMSFVAEERHWYELVWRLSEAIHEEGSYRLKYESGQEIWPLKKQPIVFKRNVDGVLIGKKKKG